jgi:hypothetical protein
MEMWWFGSLSRRLQQGIWMDPLFNRRAREPVLLPSSRVRRSRIRDCSIDG